MICFSRTPWALLTWVVATPGARMEAMHALPLQSTTRPVERHVECQAFPCTPAHLFSHHSCRPPLPHSSAHGRDLVLAAFEGQPQLLAATSSHALCMLVGNAEKTDLSFAQQQMEPTRYGLKSHPTHPKRRPISIKDNHMTKESAITLCVAAKDAAQEPATTKGYPRLSRARLAQAALSQDECLP